jgi:hypothetical protein
MFSCSRSARQEFPISSKVLEREVRKRPVAVGLEGPPTDGDKLSYFCVFISPHVSASLVNNQGFFLQHCTVASVMEHGAERYYNAPLFLS